MTRREPEGGDWPGNAMVFMLLSAKGKMRIDIDNLPITPTIIPHPHEKKINILCKMKNEGVARSPKEQRHENGMTK